MTTKASPDPSGKAKPPSPHPELDKFKAWLAGMSADDRRQTMRLLAQVVQQQMEASEAKKAAP